MITLRTWARRYLAPLAAEEGLTGRGLTFRLTAGNGDCGVLELQEFRVDPARVVFEVRVAVVPAPAWSWVCRGDADRAGTRPPSSSGALVSWRVPPPEHLAHAPHQEPFTAEWAYGGPVDTHDAGRALVDVLRARTVPDVRRLLDRRALEAEVERPTFDFHRSRPPGWARVLLRVDDTPPADLEGLLAGVETHYPAVDEFKAWARRRAGGGSAG
jgi:hypothetical protein